VRATVTSPSLSMLRSLSLLVFAICALSVSSTANAQAPRREAAAVDSTARVCMDISWLARDAVCSGRFQNTLALGLVGGIFGLADGAAGGFLIRTSCIGNYEKAAVRGAIAGAAAGTVVALAAGHISRREAAAKDARAREEAHATKPWSWEDLRPLVGVTGTAAAMGAAIGATQGARTPSPCSGGIAGGAATGAAVYGTGVVASTAALLIGVRLLF
jgi:hypothetical protein